MHPVVHTSRFALFGKQLNSQTYLWTTNEMTGKTTTLMSCLVNRFAFIYFLFSSLLQVCLSSFALVFCYFLVSVHWFARQDICFLKYASVDNITAHLTYNSLIFFPFFFSLSNYFIVLILFAALNYTKFFPSSLSLNLFWLEERRDAVNDRNGE